METRRFTKRLPVKLLDADLLGVAADMSGQISELDRLILEKREANRLINGRISTLRVQISALNRKLVTKAEDRDIDVELTRDVVRKQIRIVRLDTSEVVEERAMRPEELQMSIEDTIAPPKKAEAPAKAPKAGGRRIQLANQEAADRAEEQRLATTPEEAEEMRAERLAAERAERSEGAGAAS
ncbi:MAG: hypothetical protein JOZ88_11335 [Hyphomicrobiales bacterium]|nr:hypothetical protein [Hyphomicrobiales bacterium]